MSTTQMTDAVNLRRSQSITARDLRIAADYIDPERAAGSMRRASALHDCNLRTVQRALKKVALYDQGLRFELARVRSRDSRLVMTPEQEAQVVEMWLAGVHIRTIAEVMAVGERTVRRSVQRAQDSGIIAPGARHGDRIADGAS